MNGEHYQEIKKNPVVFLDIKFGAVKAGRMIIELFKDKVPKTAENFRSLCTGEGKSAKNGKTLHYKNTIFHRVVPVFLVQGGDTTNGDGSGGESIYGDKFDDENFSVSHDKPGIVGMANNGANSNNSQFYITTVPCTHLDNRNVAFGIVKKGFNIAVEMADIPRTDDRPLECIVIENCGELAPGESWAIEENDNTEDVYPPWPNDWSLEPEDNEKVIENAIVKIKDSGNHFFKENNLIDSERKYKKALRYIDWFLGLDTMRPSDAVCDLRVNSILNLALVKIKKKEFKQAVELCSQVIEKSPDNGKAFYRRGQARLSEKEYDKALTDLLMANSLCPNDKNVQAVLKVARTKKLTYLKREKQFFSNVFK